MVEKCTLKLVDDYNHMLCQATEPLSTFLQYITYWLILHSCHTSMSALIRDKSPKRVFSSPQLSSRILIAEVVALIADSTVHRVCITTCFLFSAELLYDVNKIFSPALSTTESITKKQDGRA
ncbi:unnamed protein product [Lupinus luteus]|uniref:Uncharacterized protein n=1 Tax=Lupinus luteus TaxID=3873 RepID=A0AAV1XZS9_LUPLU